MVSIQEAAHEVGRLDLTLCSDSLYTVNLNAANRLRKSTDQPSDKDLMNSYAKRDSSMYHLSLEQYFYKVWCNKSFMNNEKNCIDEDTKREKARVLLYKGLNCRPRYPADYDYARGMLIMHRPWRLGKPPTPNSKKETVDIFLRMIDQKELPQTVIMEYDRAYKYSKERRVEMTSQEGVIQDEEDAEEMDEEERLNLIHTSHYTNGHLDGGRSEGTEDNLDLGEDHFSEQRDTSIAGEDYISSLRTEYAQLKADNADNLDIPTTKEGKQFEFKDLSKEQQAIVLATIDTVWKFLFNDKDYEPLRATITGLGGAGKSFVIKVVTTLVRLLTQRNETVQVAAPTGSSAYNVNGCTLHRLLGIDVNFPTKNLSREQTDALKTQLQRLMVLIIDERSLLSCQVVAAAEDHARNAAFNGHNSEEIWAGIPVVLTFGDDYQLPAVMNDGILNRINKINLNEPQAPNYQHKNKQISDEVGARLLSQCQTASVFELTKNFRVKDELHRELLERLRTGDPTESDCERLCSLHFCNYTSNEQKQYVQDVESSPKTVWLFTKNADKHKKNMKCLLEHQKKTGHPVAKLNCHYQQDRTYNRPSGQKGASAGDHFNGKAIIRSNHLCIGARVTIDTLNYEPALGLYNGVFGTVVEIVYEDSVGPNKNNTYHLPKYVVLDIPQFRLPPGLEPWDKNHPQVSHTKWKQEIKLAMIQPLTQAHILLTFEDHHSMFLSHQYTQDVNIAEPGRVVVSNTCR